MGFDHLINQTELQPKRVTKARFRRRIFAEWAHRCAYCGDPADTLDHVLPRSKGGLTVAQNLIPACRRCNGAKSSTDWREWFRAQAWYCPEREGRIDGWLRGGDPPAGEHHAEHVDRMVARVAADLLAEPNHQPAGAAIGIGSHCDKRPIVTRLGELCSGCHARPRPFPQSVQAGDDGRSPATGGADEPR